MKLLILGILFLLSTPASAATDYSNCDAKYRFCEKPKSCEAFYACQKSALEKLNVLVGKTMDEIELEKYELCAEKRKDMEFDIISHSTTIECVNTPNGPQFGG